jgi:hypothetical protein
MLIQSYLVTMEDIGVETWLVHGTLLGWYWNQKVGRSIIDMTFPTNRVIDLTVGYGR